MDHPAVGPAAEERVNVLSGLLASAQHRHGGGCPQQAAGQGPGHGALETRLWRFGVAAAGKARGCSPDPPRGVGAPTARWLQPAVRFSG